MSQSVVNATAKAGEVETKAEALETQLTDLAVAAEEKLSEWQADFTDRQTSRAEDHSEAEIERKKNFEELLSEWKDSVATQSAKITQTQTDKLQATLDHFIDSGGSVLKDMNEKHQSVLEIHKLVGRDSVAGGYQKSAGEESGAANLWRLISMTSLIAAIIWLGFKYWIGFEQTATGGVNWAEIITASSLTAIFLISAGYASRQSKMHRDNEKQFRSFALETKALDPFIANLDETVQKEIKAELVRRMFGQQHMHTSTRSVKIDESTVATSAESLVQAVKKLVDKT